MFRLIKVVSLISVCFLLARPSGAQFVEQFDKPADTSNPRLPGWVFFSGDGMATIDMIQRDGYASVIVDATKDKRNIWWAVIRHRVTGIDMEQLVKPGYELRLEARIKVSHAPRRVNLHFNHTRTTDFHSHLMEYDIPDTSNWHTISLTTHDFDARLGDSINAQMAVIDWGTEKYKVDVDYIKVDVVNRNTVGPDKGAKLPYHPPVSDPASFPHHPGVAHDAVINEQYQDMNFNNWHVQDDVNPTSLLTVSGDQIVIMRWDLSDYRGKKVARSGLLELTTHSLQRSPDYQKDFGMVRVVEILDGDPNWEQEKVTFDSFRKGKTINRVLNSQMIIDWNVARKRGDKTHFTITQPVLQRMIDGRTLGLAVRPLGAVVASFYSSENPDMEVHPKLHMEFEGDHYTLVGGKNFLTDITPVHPDGDINVVVEIPTGTLEKWELDKTSGELKLQSMNGNPRIINYIGYPGNYGLIPQTLLPKELGGDGDPLDVIVLGPAVERGSVIKCKLIGVLEMLDEKEQDDKLIAVASGTSMYAIDNLQELNANHRGITEILELWFTNYEGPGIVEIKGFRNEVRAREILDAAINAYKSNGSN